MAGDGYRCTRTRTHTHTHTGTKKKKLLPCYKRPDLQSFALRLVFQERIAIVYRGFGVCGKQEVILERSQEGNGREKSEACRIRRSNGVIVGKNEEIRKVWKSHFERMMNESMGGRAEVTTMGIKIHEERPHAQGRLEWGEIVEAIRKLKLGKALAQMG